MNPSAALFYLLTYASFFFSFFFSEFPPLYKINANLFLGKNYFRQFGCTRENNL